MSPQPEPPMNSPPPSSKHALAPIVGLVVFVAAVLATIHLYAYGKRQSARAEAFRATILQGALGGGPENFLRYEEARRK
jgi:hypothetical protein